MIKIILLSLLFFCLSCSSSKYYPAKQANLILTNQEEPTIRSKLIPLFKMIGDSSPSYLEIGKTLINSETTYFAKALLNVDTTKIAYAILFNLSYFPFDCHVMDYNAPHELPPSSLSTPFLLDSAIVASKKLQDYLGLLDWQLSSIEANSCNYFLTLYPTKYDHKDHKSFMTTDPLYNKYVKITLTRSYKIAGFQAKMK